MVKRKDDLMCLFFHNSVLGESPRSRSSSQRVGHGQASRVYCGCQTCWQSCPEGPGPGVCGCVCVCACWCVCVVVCVCVCVLCVCLCVCVCVWLQISWAYTCLGQLPCASRMCTHL